MSSLHGVPFHPPCGAPLPLPLRVQSPPQRGAPYPPTNSMRSPLSSRKQSHLPCGESSLLSRSAKFLITRRAPSHIPNYIFPFNPSFPTLNSPTLSISISKSFTISPLINPAVFLNTTYGSNIDRPIFPFNPSFPTLNSPTTSISISKSFTSTTNLGSILRSNITLSILGTYREW